ncbi:hypothetical protein C790_01027 [Morganella morganii SC01]|nr:hypothetical protein C790_01027 [Morganella morganii SC01]
MQHNKNIKLKVITSIIITETIITFLQSNTLPFAGNNSIN